KNRHNGHRGRAHERRMAPSPLGSPLHERWFPRMLEGVVRQMPLDVFLKLISVLVASCRIGFQAVSNHRFDGRAHGLVPATNGGAGRFSARDQTGDDRIGWALRDFERASPRQELKEDDSQRVDVASSVYRRRLTLKRIELFRR